MRFADELPPPPAGHAYRLGDVTVEHRLCSCCPDPRPWFFVRDRDGVAQTMSSDWRLLCHYRRWQIDTAELARRPASWPESEMTAWQLLCWKIIRPQLAVDDAPTFPAIPSVHPDCPHQPLPEPFPWTSNPSPPRSTSAVATPPSAVTKSKPRSASSSTTSELGSTSHAPTSKRPPSGSPAPVTSSERATPPAESPSTKAAPSGQQSLF